MAKQPPNEARDTATANRKSRPRRADTPRDVQFAESNNTRSEPEQLTSESARDQDEGEPLSPTDEDIRMRAYHRYLERCAGHGGDFDDWLEAERELKQRR